MKFASRTTIWEIDWRAIAAISLAIAVVLVACVWSAA
jgi:hypothetical protein